ncbi:CcmD family protein [Seleniivibrio woodruffii]|uniref:CcmD family protein n=1 Tax=Seleniivibrio woodruffii TaxID=1078050 RepID=A0A4R1K5F8_9BACT|nr:CcmD family protein [Seleniivibrio woodruffii]TCK59384.1 CcmD family protein [Seleniivibrio woodruffii]TVZ35575.1 CcmD family protein [Seleniivibrio woodruffii]
MGNFTYLFAGYTVIFVLLGGYFFSLGIRLKNLEDRVESLENK